MELEKFEEDTFFFFNKVRDLEGRQKADVSSLQEWLNFRYTDTEI